MLSMGDMSLCFALCSATTMATAFAVSVDSVIQARMAQFDSIPDAKPRFISGFLWIVIIAGLAILPAFFFGPALGHSLANNQVWLSSFDAGIWRGEIYPRWLPELWYGAGAPDFFFYGPLPFWVSSTLGRTICWHCDVSGLLNAGTLVILALSGFGYYLFASRFLDRNNALIAAGFYIILPYHLMIDWGVRQALGELAAFSVFPFITYFTVGLFRRERWSGIGLALSVAALSLSHLPSVVICAAVLVPMAVYYSFRKTTWNERLLFMSRAAGFALLGLGLAAFYWLPAFALLPDVASQTLWQTAFNWSHWLFFDGLPEPNEALTILLKVWLIGITIFMLLFVRRLVKNKEVAVWVLLPLTIGWVFMTPLSWPLWKALPFLQAIQFPWRFMMVAEFGVPLAVAFLLPRQRFVLLAAGTTLMIISVLSGFGGYQLSHIMGVPQQIVDGNVADHLSAWEYLPKTAFEPIMKLTGGKRDALRADWSANPGELAQASVSPAAKVNVQELSSRHWIVDVEQGEAQQVIFRQFYWKLWKAHDLVTGQEITLSAEPKFGLIEFDAPVGTHEISIDLDWHWSEELGLLISLISAVALGIFVWRWQSMREIEEHA